MTDVVVTVVANPQPFVAGMQEATAASQQAAVGIDASLGSISAAAEGMIAAAQATMARIQVAPLETQEAARAATVAWNTAKTQIAEAEAALASVEEQHLARIRAMVAASAQQVEANNAVAQSTRFAAAAESAYIHWTEEEAAAFANNVRLRQAMQITSNRAASVLAEEATAHELNTVAINEETAATARLAISSRTSYEVGVLTSEALSGNFARMQRSLAALGNSTGIMQELADFMIRIPAPVYAAAVAVGVFELAQIAGARETEKFEKALATSNNASGQTVQNMRDMTEAIGNSIHNWGAAEEAVIALASSGKVASGMFEEVAHGVAALAELTGKSVKEIATEFEKLGEDPVKQVAKLNEAYHFLTIEQFQEIDAMAKAGDVAEATARSQELLADASIKRLQEVQDKLPPMVKWWENLRDAANMAWAAMKHTGDDSLSEQMDNNRMKVALLDTAYSAYLATLGKTNPVTQSVANLIKGLDEEYVKLNAQYQNTSGIEKRTAAEKAQADAENQAAIKAQQNIDALTARYGKEETAVERVSRAQQDLMKIYASGGDLPKGMFAENINGELKIAGPAWDDLVNHINKGTDSYKAAAHAATEYAQATKALQSDQEKVNRLVNEFSGRGDAVSEAWAKYNDEMSRLVAADDKILDDWQKKIDFATTEAQRTEAITGYTEALNAARQRESEIGAHLLEITRDHIAALGDWQEILNSMQATYTRQEELEGMTSTQRRVATEVIRAEEKALQELHKINKDIIALSPEQKAAADAEAENHVHVMEAIEQHKKVLQEWENIAKSGFDSVSENIANFIAGNIHSWHDFGAALVSTTRQFIASIINEFLKLTVFNGIINNLFGLTGSAALPTGLGNGWLGQIFGGGGGDVTGGSISNMSFGGGDSFIGKMLGGIFGGGGGAAAMGGVGILAGGVNNLSAAGDAYGVADITTRLPPLVNNLSESTNAFTSALSKTTELFKEWAPVLSAAVVGYQVGGVAGAVALGVAAYFVPVVGWIAGVAGVVNQLTGGGLFGTDWKPTGASTTQVSIGDDVSIKNTIEESKKQSFFRGHKWKNVDVPVTDEQMTNAVSMQEQLRSGVTEFAAQFGRTVGSLIGGTFTIEKDKSGKETFSSTVGADKFTGEDSQKWAERLQSANFLKVLDDMGLGASEFVKGVKNDADKLAAAVQDFASVAQNANTNLGKGFKFMALSADQTLVDVVNFVKTMQAGGETLSQTYQRLAKAQQDYNNFVEQFKPGTVYVDSFEEGMSKIYHAMLDNAKQANDLAIAAGAAGASQEDLTNIYQYAAIQMAALTAQTQANAQQLAFSLGLTTVGTLDQINQEIAALEGTASATDSATKSVKNFGSAVRESAKQADDAIQLLIGNLSPLNDQEKLLIAKQGLRQGTVTQEEVLQIGQRLYASSQAYVDLFNEVKQYAPHQNQQDRWHSGSVQIIATGVNATDVKQSKLSPEDQAKLDELKKERDTLEASQKLEQFRTLATQVVEVAAAKGEDFQQVLDEMKVQGKDLAKGLGLKDEAELRKYMEALKQQLDSAHENTKSIVDAVEALPQRIADAIDGKITHQAFTRPQPSPPPSGDGTDTGGAGPATGDRVDFRGRTRQMSDDEFTTVLAVKIGDQINKPISKVLAAPSRNTRQVGRYANN